jgi:hypothetical protein
MRIVKHVTIAAAAAAVVIAGSAAPSAQQATTPQAAAAAPHKYGTLERTDSLVQGYSIVLVLGDMQAGSTPDNVPPAAKKALADMKDFLPYKSYRLLDSQWTLGSSNVSTRLRGADDQDYSLSMGSRLVDDGSRTLSVSFQLREGADVLGITRRPMSSVNETTADIERRLVEVRAAEAKARGASDNHPEVRAGVSGGVAGGVSGGVQGGVGSGVGTGVGRGATTVVGRNGSIISTTFTMDVGETVVVGTSRLKGGDKALIALLTAVPRSKAGAAKE